MIPIARTPWPNMVTRFFENARICFLPKLWPRQSTLLQTDVVKPEAGLPLKDFHFAPLLVAKLEGLYD